jgi:hypothetical protein
LLLFYKPLHLEAQQVSTRIEVRRHQPVELVVAGLLRLDDRRAAARLRGGGDAMLYSRQV